MRWVLLLAAGLIGLAQVTWPGPARSTTPVTAQDCTEITVWSNGFHTSLSIPAAIFEADHPLRQAMPEAAYLLVGWGEAGFYREGPGFWRGLDALAPPSPSVVHLIGSDEPVERFYTPTRVQTAALSSAQAAGLAAFLARETATENGAPVVLGDGHAGAQSLFLEGRSSFHGLYVCNHWTARALRAAGLSVGSRLSFRADGVLDDLARSAPQACPAG
jgi:uncharacterized protein (TIGR02117 family)